MLAVSFRLPFRIVEKTITKTLKSVNNFQQWKFIGLSANVQQNNLDNHNVNSYRNFTSCFSKVFEYTSSKHYNVPLVVQKRQYKVKKNLKKRCPHCYFRIRQGRWYVECKVKPRHKQMQQIPKSKIWRED